MARIAARISFAVAVATGSAWVTLHPWSVAAQQQQLQSAQATADIRDASGRAVASAELREDAGKVQVVLVLPTPSTLSGKHALHIMEIGRCDPPGFSSSGGIFNPLGKKHGILASGGAMVGDLPNLTLPIQRYNAPALGASLGPGPTSLVGPNGTALVVYAAEDDGLTGPEGNAGARIACGVITASQVGSSTFQTMTTFLQSTPGVAGISTSGSAPPASVPSGSSNPGLAPGPAIIIVVLGAASIGAGLMLRRPRRL